MTTKSEAVRMDETTSNNQELTADDLRGVQGGLSDPWKLVNDWVYPSTGPVYPSTGPCFPVPGSTGPYWPVPR
jgi:hypothetical protein